MAENTDTFELSTLELASNEDNGKIDKKKNDFKSMSFKQKILFFGSQITVEPLLLCYIFPSVLSQISVVHLNMDKACRVNLNYTEAVCNSIKDGTAGSELEAESIKVQGLVAGILVWRTPLGKALPAIMSLFVGAWSDRTGNRSILMIVPVIGELVTGIGLLLSVYFLLEWPLETAGIIEAVPTALSGGFSIMLLAMYSYMADITTPENRTFRIGLVVILVTLSIPVGTALSGVLLREWGYYGVFSICVALYITGIIYGILRLKNVRKPQEKNTRNCSEFFSLKPVYDTIMVVLKSRPGTRRARIIILILTFILIAGPLYGEGELSFLYLNYKFKLTAVDLSLYSTYSSLVGIVGSIISITILTKLLRMDDMLMGVVSDISRVAAELLMTFANTRTLLGVVPLVDLLSHTAITAIRSTATKLVDPDEVGKVASVIGLVEAVIPIVFSPIFSSVYVATLDKLPGAFYLLGATITLPSILTFLVIYFLQKKDGNVVSDPEAKEYYARENEVTAL